MTAPGAVYAIWIGMLVISVLIVLPVAVALLHRTLLAARSIERYFAEMRDAGVGIAGNTAAVPALDETIVVATEILATADALREHAGTIEAALTARAPRDEQIA